MGLFSTPKIKPDPAATAAIKQQQAVADNSLTQSIQTGLQADTRDQMRQFGFQPGTATYGTYGGNTPTTGMGGGSGDIFGALFQQLSNSAKNVMGKGG